MSGEEDGEKEKKKNGFVFLPGVYRVKVFSIFLIIIFPESEILLLYGYFDGRGSSLVDGRSFVQIFITFSCL